MSQHIVISALGNDQPSIVEQLSKTILDLGGNIHKSNMNILGGEFALMLLVEGNEAMLDKWLATYPKLEKSLSLTITSKVTLKTTDNPHVLAKAHVEAMDHPGIVHKVTAFFSQQHINIESLETGTYPAPHTGTPIFSFGATLQVPLTVANKELTDDFEAFCLQLGLDGEFNIV